MTSRAKEIISHHFQVKQGHAAQNSLPGHTDLSSLSRRSFTGLLVLLAGGDLLLLGLGCGERLRLALGGGDRLRLALGGGERLRLALGGGDLLRFALNGSGDRLLLLADRRSRKSVEDWNIQMNLKLYHKNKHLNYCTYEICKS